MNKEKIFKELSKIAKNNGGFVNPHKVVEYAKNPKSAMHSCFDWDDTEAASKWRVHQARLLITQIFVTVSPSNNEPVRALVSLVGDRNRQGGYRLMGSVLKDDDLTKRMLNDAKAMMVIFIARFKKLEKVTAVIDAMESFMQETAPVPLINIEAKSAVN